MSIDITFIQKNETMKKNRQNNPEINIKIYLKNNKITFKMNKYLL